MTQNNGVNLDAMEANGENRLYYGYIEEILGTRLCGVPNCIVPLSLGSK
jgi:hypothetical protein